MQVKVNKKIGKGKVRKLTVPFNGKNQAVCFEKGIAQIDDIKFKGDEAGELPDKLAKLLAMTFDFLDLVEPQAPKPE